MIQCGAIDDVYSYEKMKRLSSDSHGHHDFAPATKPAHRKTTSFSDAISESSTGNSARLGRKKSQSFRWITGNGGGGGTLGTSKRFEKGVTREAQQESPPSPTKKPKKRIGLVDILLGYHSLLQASPYASLFKQKKQLHPTLGFLRNSDYGTQR